MAGIPANAQVIWDYLIGKGASNNAAAGILGNIEQESGGDPAAGPWPQQYGLIQWTPPTNYFSSPPSLAQQLPAIIAYINANGGMADINAHHSPAPPTQHPPPVQDKSQETTKHTEDGKPENSRTP